MRRSGATLTEVLIALMILSIGIVSIAALFPIATLRAIKATQLTNATDLRYNAEALLDLFPDAIANPDLNYVLPLPPPPQKPVKNTAEHEPPPPGALGPDLSRWVIDPIGWRLLRNAGTGLQDYFGADGTGTPLPVNRAIPRYPLGFYDLSAASAFQAMPDSWTAYLDGDVPNFTPTQADVAGLVGADMLDATGALVATFRAVLFDADQKVQFRTLTNATGSTVQWAAPLPAGFAPVSARIESQEGRYTFLFTVRRQPSTALPDCVADVDVAIFFRRSFDASDDERFWPLNAGFSQGSNQIRVDISAGKPNLKKGGFCFDGDGAYWYRVRDFTVTPANPNEAVVTLETSARASSPAAGGLAMFPRNVVDVYPLGQKVVTP